MSGKSYGDIWVRFIVLNKCQKISAAILPKTQQRNYFNSALVSKMSQTKNHDNLLYEKDPN